MRWVYDEAEVDARLEAGTYVSWIAESAAGELLCHEGMSPAAAGDAVGHSGQAVTMPAARGQHLFTRTKQHLMDWRASTGWRGCSARRPPPTPTASEELANLILASWPGPESPRWTAEH